MAVSSYSPHSCFSTAYSMPTHLFPHTLAHSLVPTCLHTHTHLTQTHIKEWCNVLLIWQLAVPREHSGHLRCEMPPAVCGKECESVCACVLHCLTHSTGGIHDVITGPGSGWGVLFGGLAMCWCHIANPQLVCVCACVCFTTILPLRWPRALLSWPIVCVLWFPTHPGPQCYCNTHTSMHTYTTKCLVTEWCTG